MSRAGLLLALGLGAGALWPEAPIPAPCTAAREIASRDTHTTAVECGHAGALRGPARLLWGMPLDANHADARSLEALPGVGPARAAALVAARADGRFCNAADLERVPGIGPATAARIAPLLAFSCPG